MTKLWRRILGRRQQPVELDDIKIYITTSDDHLEYLKVTTYLLNKYWPVARPVTIVGYARPNFELPDNFKFVSMGSQVGGARRWATDLKKFFSGLQDDYLIHGLDDYFICRPVDVEVLETLVNNHLDKSVGWVGLTIGPSMRSHRCVRSYQDFEVIELAQDADYRITAQFNLWNREYLLKHLIEGDTPWDFEVKGSERARHDKMQILAAKGRIAIHKIDGIRKELPGIYHLGGLDKKVINEMRSLDMIPPHDEKINLKILNYYLDIYQLNKNDRRVVENILYASFDLGRHEEYKHVAEIYLRNNSEDIEMKHLVEEIYKN